MHHQKHTPCGKPRPGLFDVVSVKTGCEPADGQSEKIRQ
jgi:hypothetical protein